MVRALAEPEAVKLRIDGDDVDLAHRRCGVIVHLRPAERGQPAVALVQPEAFRVEPWLGLTLPQGVDGPAALLGMIVECGVVDPQPFGLVVTDDEGACVDRCRSHRSATADASAAAAGPG